MSRDFPLVCGEFGGLCLVTGWARGVTADYDWSVVNFLDSVASAPLKGV